MWSKMKGVMLTRFVLALALAALAGIAAAQQMYRWTDENGRTHITDTPPPPGAKNVRKVKPPATDKPAKPDAQLPFVLARAMKEYPVSLYTSPNCTEPCAAARELLNKRGVPFNEVQVWEEEGNAELKKLSGNTQVPTIKVGASVQSGYDPAMYAALLDTAGYPREGVLPAGMQVAPGRPDGYVPPDERELPKAEPVKPEPPTASGPYAPGAKPQRAQPK
ncbi:MAG TPA: glutaredoxin family protein [Burkholderiales bacterium]|nr:glutaredoxin family protein [Burkholderiales bacterium]